MVGHLCPSRSSEAIPSWIVTMVSSRTASGESLEGRRINGVAVKSGAGRTDNDLLTSALSFEESNDGLKEMSLNHEKGSSRGGGEGQEDADG